jgi:hypothetical protein
MNTNMKRIAIATLGGFAVLCVIASCSHHDDVAYVQPQQAPVLAAAPAPVYAAPPAVVVQAAPAHDGFLTGMLMGHMMSGGGWSRVEHHYIPSGGLPVQRNVVQNVTKNVTINKTVNAPAAPVAAPRPSYSAPSYSSASRSAYSGYTSRPSTSYSSGYSSRSSYSSYSSRSSFGGRR